MVAFDLFNSVDDYQNALGGTTASTQDFESFADGDNLDGVEFLPGVFVDSNLPQVEAFQGSGDQNLFGFGGSVRQEGNAFYDINFNQPYNAVGFDIDSFNPETPGPAVVEIFFANDIDLNFDGEIDLNTSTDLDPPDETIEIFPTNATETEPIFFGIVADTPIERIRLKEGPEIGGSGNEEIALDNFVVGEADGGESDSLLIPVELGSVPKRPDSDSPTIIREQFVKVNFDNLPEEIGTQGETVALNLFDNTTVEVGIESIESSTDEEHLVYQGSINNANFSEVTLVKSLESDLIVGNIRVDDQYYQIRYVAEEIHTIREIDASQFPNADEHDSDSNLEDLISEDTEVNLLSAADSEVDDGSLIDVMVAYTAETRAVEGGTAAMNAVITLAETETNQGYENSDVDQRIQIVHRVEVDYDESDNSSTDLARLRNTSDGFMDNVHALRDEYSADMVSLFVNDFDACGRGYLMTTPSYSFESSGFSVVKTECATGYYSFAHELGHNQGAGHDVGNGGGSYPYSQGYVDPDGGFRTIMAFNPSDGYVPRINRWSNPDQTYNGDPIGVAGVSDNRRTLNENAIYAANWRHSNDNLDNAEEIVGTSFSTTALNVNGTEETGEINHAGNSGGTSVWWTWTALTSGAFEVNTAGSDFNTLLGVYTGSSLASLTEIASNDDVSGGDQTSQVSFDAVAGTTYKIAVDGYNGDGGEILLTLQPDEPGEINGTDEDDLLEGTPKKDIINGFDGNDTLIGKESDDRLKGGEGDDLLQGDSGNDTLNGGENSDNLHGGDGNDILTGDDGDDFINAGPGNDQLDGGESRDEMFGGVGDDTLNGGDNGDTLNGGEGKDILTGEDGDDFMTGGAGDDQLDGGEGRDEMFGDQGDDTLNGGDNGDTLNGGEGKDILTGEDGDDFMTGGAGDDQLDGGEDRDEMFGGVGDDILTGGNNNDILDGGQGNDLLSGGDGDDQFVLKAGAGEDIISDYQDGDDLFKLVDLTFEQLTIAPETGGTSISITTQTTEVLAFLTGVDASVIGLEDFVY